MSQPELVFIAPGADGVAELVVNFGVYSGREATPAEIERLARSLLPGLRAPEVVCEQRYEFTQDVEATVYASGSRPRCRPRSDELRDALAAWARDCIGERRVSL